MDETTDLDLPRIDDSVPPETSETDGQSEALQDLEAMFRARLEGRGADPSGSDSHIVRLRTNLEALERNNLELRGERDRLLDRLQALDARARESEESAAEPGAAAACASVFQPEDALRRAQAAERALAAAQDEIEQLNHRICLIERFLPEAEDEAANGRTCPDLLASGRTSDDLLAGAFSERERRLQRREEQAQSLRDELARRAEELVDARDRIARLDERVEDLERKLAAARRKSAASVTAAPAQEVAPAPPAPAEVPPVPVEEAAPVDVPAAPAPEPAPALESVPLRAHDVSVGSTESPVGVRVAREADAAAARPTSGVAGVSELPSIEGYVVERVCDVTPYGATYQAREASNRRPVQVQLLSARMRETVGRHLDGLVAARHGNLFETIAWGVAPLGVYVVSERPRGERAQAWIDRIGSLPEHAAISVALQVARGLREAAFRGVHHGDLGLRAIRLEASGRVRVEGAGRLGLDPSQPVPPLEPAYAAPERLRGSPPPDARSDIYSLGAVLYTLLTGQAPYRGTPEEIERMQASERFPDVRAGRPDVSDGTVALLESMTRRDPDRRPGDWDRTLLELERRAGAQDDAAEGGVQRLFEWVQEHPAALAALIAAPLALLALVAALL